VGNPGTVNRMVIVIRIPEAWLDTVAALATGSTTLATVLEPQPASPAPPPAHSPTTAPVRMPRRMREGLRTVRVTIEPDLSVWDSEVYRSPGSLGGYCETGEVAFSAVRMIRS
jgi:hypothetical protein